MVLKLIMFCLVISVVYIEWASADGDTPKTHGYDTKYDNINLDDLLKNDRLRKNYVKCLLNEGPCTPDATELKNSLPDAIATNCSKCTEKQKNGSEKVTHFLIDNEPDEWDQLAAIYDKDGEYKQKYIASKVMESTVATVKNADGNEENAKNERNEQNNDENKNE
ncbi:ejaculatory bulb-specific protein 3-like [Contarinia nasturtii]|uniref:ejaculatory bulb-specific protein 3-like n=1 Tax=Contarinia nasturtii TaxID=265458 RepID=UPI0012D39AEA|nr:ejaculatory bulb-specific protein 3-like [Contarinia nasturtii]